MARPWVLKYTPVLLADVIGQERAVASARNFLESYRRGDKPLLLVGPSGTGKTALVYALAEESKRELLEVNASDSRNKTNLEALLGPALQQQSLFLRGKIILVDEADSVSGVKDRGGNTALAKLVLESGHPIILTANDIDSPKIKPLKKISTVVELKPLEVSKITQRLRFIANAEKISVEDSELTTIARRSGGDLRAAITDFQSVVTGDSVSKQDVKLLSDREQKEEVIQALLRVFKTTSADVALPAFDAVDEDPQKLILWMDENIPREYKKPEDLARAFDALAEADRFFGRIRRWQYYRFYVYLYNLISAGIALAKDEKYPGAGDYKETDRLLKIWIYNRKNQKRKELAEQLAKHLHTSSKRVTQDVLPYLKYASRKKGFSERISKEYEVDTDWLN